MAADLASVPFCRRGYSQRRMSSKRTRKVPAPHTISQPTGRMGFGGVPSDSEWDSSADVVPDRALWKSTEMVSRPGADDVTITLTPGLLAGRSGRSGELQEDEHHEADEGERLGEGDGKEHRGAHQAGRLGLASHGLHRLADEVADAD